MRPLAKITVFFVVVLVAVGAIIYLQGPRLDPCDIAALEPQKSSRLALASKPIRAFINAGCTPVPEEKFDDHLEHMNLQTWYLFARYVFKEPRNDDGSLLDMDRFMEGWTSDHLKALSSMDRLLDMGSYTQFLNLIVFDCDADWACIKEKVAQYFPADMFDEQASCFIGAPDPSRCVPYGAKYNVLYNPAQNAGSPKSETLALAQEVYFCEALASGCTPELLNVDRFSIGRDQDHAGGVFGPDPAWCRFAQWLPHDWWKDSCLKKEPW